MSKEIKAIIFDWGGTCTKGDIAKKFSKSLSVITGIPQAKIEKAFEINNKSYILGKMKGKDFWKAFANDLGISKPPEFFIEMFREAGRADPKMIKLAKSVKRSYKTTLLSDNYKELADWISAEYKLRDVFNVIIFSNKEGAKKPGKRIFKIALVRLGIQAGEAVFIDDKERNVKAAKELGIKAILFKGDEKLKCTLSEMGIRGSK
ncbi:MAG: HAD family phosphatase [Candidatus Aenigmarchaeota archaeon]|nr:HAD family phosphatase [Candidatus Aenigmarchaeota archaeon]